MFAGYTLCAAGFCLGDNASNLCGLPAVFICVPGGFVAGMVVAIVMLSRSRKPISKAPEQKGE
jgi:hypothetical protein